MLPFLVLVALISGNSAQTQSTGCTCGGTELKLADQVHCFQIIPGTGGSWVSADAKCGAHGGFLAHINSSSLISQLKSYIDANYKNPLMVGETVGNVQTKLVALMCPNNQYSSVLSSSVISSLFTGNLTTTNRCVFLQKWDYKLHYGACEATADVLCDFRDDGKARRCLRCAVELYQYDHFYHHYLNYAHHICQFLNDFVFYNDDFFHTEYEEYKAAHNSARRKQQFQYEHDHERDNADLSVVHD
ncbi:CBN-CWP-5 protein [Aphelenchoides avenae]|nr:CBN-CWP-5 protein [Aphelenchus avenae]